MSKSDVTKSLERSIKRQTSKMGTFGCFEVTINKDGKDERIDYLTYETKGIWRCYEVKSSLADFNSKARHTFIGHFNYYVMTDELYEQVKDKIPKHVGVYTNWCIKKPKKVELGLEHEYLMYCMMRSLHGRYQNLSKSADEEVIHRLNRTISGLERERDRWSDQYTKLQSILINEFGYDEYRKLLRKGEDRE